VGVGGIVGTGGAAGAGDGGDRIGPGVLAYLGEGRDELEVDLAPGARVILLGGAPFGEQIVMAWNFVGRSREELDRAAADWNAGDERFGSVDSRLPRIPAP
jgi:redox-sensitive bicupin YhaK (pirin superfamily)